MVHCAYNNTGLVMMMKESMKEKVKMTHGYSNAWFYFKDFVLYSYNGFCVVPVAL